MNSFLESCFHPLHEDSLQINHTKYSSRKGEHGSKLIGRRGVESTPARCTIYSCGVFNEAGRWHQGLATALGRRNVVHQADSGLLAAELTNGRIVDYNCIAVELSIAKGTEHQ
ncbi:hypothetical protein AVEN_133016-1 [Araneus ventricosus]|uniref:Uncharacterized protein n=1 Tax=Araneus ventricosus TaxID=182803 RepID=A0A4Y2LN76_ARAVE|nr:hypothetical protein AVEN_133016-1 [Araneus ventricosus]